MLLFAVFAGPPLQQPAPRQRRPSRPSLLGSPDAGLSSNVAAALSYLVGFITGIIFLVVEPYKKR